MKRKYRMRFLRRCAACIVIASTAFCTIFASAGGSEVGKVLVLTVEPGKNWTNSFRTMLLVRIKNEPQMAFWLEDEQGSYVATIFVTRRTATQDWRATFGEKRERIERPSSLPVWVAKHVQGGIEPRSLCSACHSLHKQKKKTIEDSSLRAVTGATPKAEFTYEWKLPSEIKPGSYKVRGEINHSKDFNENYPEKAAAGDSGYSGGPMGSGQPSVIWEATIYIGDEPSSAELEIIGHGHPSGATGEIFTELGTLSSALEIVKSIRVDFKPGS